MKSLQKRLVCFVLIFFIFGCRTTIKIVITSDPPGADIYMGEAPQLMSYAGKTPLTLEYGDNEPHWKAWYYQIKKVGFEDSEFIFEPEGAIGADRYVHTTLEPVGERDTNAGQKAVEDVVQIEKAEEEIKPLKSETKSEDENVKCAEIQRLSDELMSLMTTFSPPTPNIEWDFETKAHHPPQQSLLSNLNKLNGVSLKILRLMDELNTVGPEQEISECKVVINVTFSRKATVSFKAKGLIDRDDARIEYMMTSEAPAILLIDFTVVAAPVEIIGYGFSIISEHIFLSAASTHIEFKGTITWLGETVEATQFACIRGPNVLMGGSKMMIEPYFSVPFTATVDPPEVYFQTNKVPPKGPLAFLQLAKGQPINLTEQDLQKAFEKGHLPLGTLSGTVTIDFAPPDPELEAPPGQSDSGGIGLWGDRTTHGGFLLATENEVFSEKHPVAKEGDPVLCPIHGLSKVSRDESSGVYIGGKTVAVAGGKADCGAKILNESTFTLVRTGKQ